MTALALLQAPLAATREIVVVANPAARRHRPRRLAHFVLALELAGCRVAVRLTRGPGDLADIAATLPAATDTLVVAGGDGSLNEAAAGLLRRRAPAPALALLPSGTANVLAHELGIPMDAAAAAAIVLRRRLARLHPGLAGDRPFLLMASAGFDARVVAAVDPRLKRILGRGAYGIAMLRHAFARRSALVEGTADGMPFRAGIAIAAKAAHYGGPYRLTRGTGVTMPGLRLVTLADARATTLLAAGARLVRDRLEASRARCDRAATEIRFETPGIPVQIDGDAAGVTPLTIRPSGRTLAVIVP